MFDKILIANRGEIACRVIRTARRLGLRSVAVYSDADASARHVLEADEARRLGPAPARESYLDGAGIIAAALASGARAIHPGYGFLAENAAFADACAAAGLVFIGPSPAAIRAMGSKSAAKELLSGAGVPLVPGYHGADQSPEHLQREADAIGYPLLIKASAGGGGKGMRVVEHPGEFSAALAGAQREAAAAFGDARMLLEKYLLRPRHVEIQVFADSQGQTLHLFERDCSIQRRHQKVLEEAPAPGLDGGLRERMGSAAVAAARAIGYVGAGTVEFLLAEDGAFYFMEMNTRLQVEHPVTELITGIDLVEWQLRVAAGEPLPCRQEDLAISGHAIEVRIYAEDPARDFLPATGSLSHLRLPAEGPHVRIDSGVRQGDEVSVYYDPMLAKLIVWDQDRPAALRRLQTALAACEIAGVTTNIGFLATLAAHPAFAAGEVDTGFIARHHDDLFPGERPASDRTLALAALFVLLRRAAEARATAAASNDPWSPWHRSDGWRMNADNHHSLTFFDGAREVSITAHYRSDGFLFELPGGVLTAKGELEADGSLCVELGGHRCRATVLRRGTELSVLADGRGQVLRLFDAGEQLGEPAGGGGRLTAPMPGKVIAIMVEVGTRVERGTPLLILEAMKMEHTLKAPAAGVVTAIPYPVGEMVSEGAELLTVEVEEEMP